MVKEAKYKGKWRTKYRDFEVVPGTQPFRRKYRSNFSWCLKLICTCGQMFDAEIHRLDNGAVVGCPKCVKKRRREALQKHNASRIYEYNQRKKEMVTTHEQLMKAMGSR